MNGAKRDATLLVGAALFIAGLAIGLVVGRSSSAQHPSRAAEAKPASSALAGAQLSESSSATSDQRATKIVLGNICAIPFQELYSVLSQRPRTELMDAAQQLRDSPPGRETDQKIATFFKAWAHFDAEAALAGAQLLRTAKQRQAAIGAAIEGADPAAAESVAKKISAMAADEFPPTVIANDNPQNALNWAQSIADEKIRTTAVDRIVTSWMRRNPVDASAWIRSSSLPDAEKQRLLVPPPGG